MRQPQKEKESSKPRADRADEDFIIPPPSTMHVEVVPRVVLYRADGTPLKRSIGFK